MPEEVTLPLRQAVLRPHMTIEELARVEGVSDVFMFGGMNYSMRVWVDPDQLASRGLTATDVLRAVRQQNIPVAAGVLGQPPVRKGQPYQFPLTTLGRLTDPRQFEEILLRVMPDGSKVRIKDIGRCELGAQNLDIQAKIDAARLLEDKRPPEVFQDEAPQVRFELVETENSGRPGKKTELPRRLSDASPPSAR